MCATLQENCALPHAPILPFVNVAEAMARIARACQTNLEPSFQDYIRDFTSASPADQWDLLRPPPSLFTHSQPLQIGDVVLGRYVAF